MKTVISKDGTRIVFDQAGTGPAIILVGGAFQHRVFDQKTAQLAEQLSAQFSPIHYDRRGRGDSGNTLPYAVEREVEDLEALIEHAGGSAFVFGMSSGAALALEAAYRRLPVKKLAIYEPPFNTGDAQARQGYRAYNQQLASYLEQGQRGEAAAFAMRTFGSPPEAIEGMKRSPAWGIFEAVAPTLAYDGAIMGDGAVPVERLASITIPVLVMDGGASPDPMRQAAQTVAKALPNATYRTLEGQTHDYAPDVLGIALKEFFTS